MKILEIKNNLIKLAFTDSEVPVLGRFLVLATDVKSYVAQFVNLKTDTVNSYAIAKLLFTFTPDGVVDNYDGSIPDVNSQVSFLPSSELLNLLPIETPIELGVLSQQEDLLNIDVSVFERNFTVFVEKDANKTTFISNCVRQLFRMKEKCVIADTCNLFEDYPKLELARDFKLPLNIQMLDYIFEYDLSEIDPPTKAIIQDIFYEVQQYIKTLDCGFLPIEKFVDVVTNQYKATQMPELALLKNKLLKYRDAGIFADTKSEIAELKAKLDAKNCVILDLKDINEELQKEVLSHIHHTLETFDKYVYFFVPLTDNNSDKRLLNQFINHNHVFTTMLANTSYKYAAELKEHAQNMIIFAPSVISNDFSAYNTFLAKLNKDECIVEGKLTQGIPFIIDMDDLDVDLTKDDVLGERVQFVPVTEEARLVKVDEFGTQTFVDGGPEPVVQPEIEPQEFPVEEELLTQEIITPEVAEPVQEEVFEPQVLVEEEPVIVKPEIVEPITNIMEEETIEEEVAVEDLHGFDEFVTNEPEISEDVEDELLPFEDSLDFEEEESLTDEDLNFIEESQMVSEDDFGEYVESPYIDEQSPVVPVYPADDEPILESVGEFLQGDSVTHPRYGRGVIEKIIKYGNKILCSISFENVGRRLLDPTISELTKLG